MFVDLASVRFELICAYFSVEGVLSLSSEFGGYPASQCLDGNVNTFCHTANEKYPYIVMEYPQEVLIKKVKVVARNGYADRVKQLVVSVTNIKPTVGEIVSGIIQTLAWDVRVKNVLGA